MTIRLSSSLLLMAVLCIVMLARAQNAISTDPSVFLRGSWARDKINLWNVHLVLHLVRHPELNKRQVRIILDAISLSSPEAKADEALQVLRRRALAAFPKDEAADLLTNIAGRKAEDDILKMYYDMSALPLKERKASFRNASSNDKSELWRTHLALFLVKRPELNERQKEIVLAAMSLVTPEYFEVQSSSPAWKTKVRDPLRSLEEEILMAFSFQDGAKIFATLGDDTEAAKRIPMPSSPVLLNSINFKQLSYSDPYKEQTQIQFGWQDRFERRGGGETCDCSTNSDWCPVYCNGTNCSPTSSGCGTLWSYPCNGACR